MSHHREIVTAEGAPEALGPYSHAVKSNGLLFCSGQIPIDPATGELVEGEARIQARQCLVNLQTVCEAAGAELADAVRTTVWLRDMGAWGGVNEVYAEFFESDPPARVAIAVAALPKGADVEIDAIVALPG
ncbi:MAG: Rid family detoxifying hydrolase [Solirubrobacteraceae bacterium]